MLYVIVAVVALIAVGNQRKRRNEKLEDTLKTLHAIGELLPETELCFQEEPEDEELEFTPITCPWELASARALADEIIGACERAAAQREAEQPQKIKRDRRKPRGFKPCNA